MDDGAAVGIDRLAPGDARAVGLGEATHGSRELFGLKARLLRRLVADAGYRTVAVEADAADWLPIGESVFRGRGDLRSELAAVDGWRYRTETVLSVLRWLQSYNADRRPAERVRLRGIDLPAPAALVSPLRSYFAAVDPPFPAETEAFETLERPIPDDSESRVAALDAMAAAAESLAARLDDRRSAYVAAGPATRWERARYCCGALVETCAWHRVRYDRPGPHVEGMAARDRGLAANVARCVERRPPVVVWAHNAHVKRGTFEADRQWAGATTMGERLARRFGAKYRPVATDVGRGRVRAVDARSEATAPRTFCLDEPLAGSTTAHLDDREPSPVTVDPRELPAAVADPGRIRHVGSVYDPEADPSWATLETWLPASFDRLAYVSRSSPSRLLGR